MDVPRGEHAVYVNMLSSINVSNGLVWTRPCVYRCHCTYKYVYSWKHIIDYKIRHINSNVNLSINRFGAFQGPLTQSGRDKMTTICLYDKCCIMMKDLLFYFFHACPIVKCQHCFPLWLGTDRTTSPYLKQWWPRLLIHACLSRHQGDNSMHTSDAIWRHISGSTLVHAMACCLTAPSHYLYQSWLIIS